jgi:hypothetical protein
MKGTGDPPRFRQGSARALHVLSRFALGVLSGACFLAAATVMIAQSLTIALAGLTLQRAAERIQMTVRRDSPSCQ